MGGGGGAAGSSTFNQETRPSFEVNVARSALLVIKQINRKAQHCQNTIKSQGKQNNNSLNNFTQKMLDSRQDGGDIVENV